MTTSPLNPPPRPSRFSLSFGKIGLVLLGVFSSPEAFADNRTWLVSSGTWTVGGNWSGALAPTDADTAVVNNSGTALLPGGVTGTYNLLQVGTTLGGQGAIRISGGLLSGTSSGLGFAAGSTGSVTITSGAWITPALRIGLLGTGNLVVNGGLVSNANASLGAFSSSAVGIATVTGGTWSNSSELIVGETGTGTLNISGGLVSVNGITSTGVASTARGTINLTGSGTLSTGGLARYDGGGVVNFDGGVLQASANSSDFITGYQVGDLRVLGGGVILDSGTYAVTISAVLSGSGALTTQGAGTVNLNAANTYTGGTIINGGTLAIGNTLATNGGSITLNQGTLDLASESLTVSSLTGSSGALITNSSSIFRTSNLTVNQSADTTYAGNMIITPGAIGALGLIKQGLGTLTLTGTVRTSGGLSSQRGDILVGSGTLAIADGGAISMKFINVNSSGSNASLLVSGGSVTATQLTAGASLADTGNIFVTGGTLDLIGISIGATGTGAMIVTGGTTVSGDFYVGQNGKGSLLLTGGVISSDLGRIGYGDEGVGIAIVSGGTWNTSETNQPFSVGTSGTGTLTVSGGLVNVKSFIRVGRTGFTTGHATINLLSGTLATPSIQEITGQGVVNFNGGALQAGANTADFISGFEAGDLRILSGGAFIDSGTYAISIVSGTTGVDLSGSGGLTKLGSGTLTLGGSNAYTGATTVSAGTLKIADQTNSAAFAIAAASTLELNVASGSRDYLSPTGTTTFTGGGTLVKSGTGSARWGGVGGVFDLSAGSLIDVQQGEIVGGSFGNEVWTTNKSGLRVATGAQFNGVEANVRVDALTGSGTIRSGYSGGYQNFTFGVADGSGTFDGILADNPGFSGNYVKTGTGTQTLTGHNTYTGTTTVERGVLVIMGDNSSGAQFIVEAGATLGGSGTLSNVTVSGILAPGSSPGLLTIEGSLTMASGSLLRMEFTGTTPGAFDQLAVGGLFTAGGTLYLDVSYAAAYGDTFQIFTDGTYTLGSFTIASNLSGGLTWDTAQLATSGVISVIPEPATWALCTLGLCGLLWYARRYPSASAC